MDKKDWNPSVEVSWIEVSEDEYRERLSELVELLLHYETVQKTFDQVYEHVNQEAA